MFWRLFRLGSFPACWRQANVTPIPKGPPSSSVANYHQISITSVLSKVFERLASVCLGLFMKHRGVLQFAYRKGLGTCDALLCMSQTLQSALESGREARIVQIDFSAGFDRVNHQGILYKLGSVVLEVLCCLYWHSFYLIDHSMLWLTVVRVNGSMLCQECCRAVFWAHYCTSYTPLSFFLFWRLSWLVMLIVVPCPGLRVAVAESLSHELVKVSEWCDLWRMKLNASKTKTMLVSRSCTMHPKSPH